MFTVQTSLARLRAFLAAPVPVSKEVTLTDKENLGHAVKPPKKSPKNKEEENASDKRERVIREKLARLARVPAEAVFESVLSSSFRSHLSLTCEIFISLESGWSPLGLTEEAARTALERHGPNISATERAPSAIALLMTAIANPFNFILIALAIISIATGDKATFSVMLVMVVLSTGLRYVFLLRGSC